MTHATALIAEDEPLLAHALIKELGRVWPQLRITATAGNGAQAVELALEHAPQVLFLDIQMPVLTGLEAASDLADRWEAVHPARPFPLLVFVTAYDQYALQAFEHAAVDYVLKPARADRLEKTVDRIQQQLQAKNWSMDQTLAQLRNLLMLTQTTSNNQASGHANAPLQQLQVSVGSKLLFLSVFDVIYFEAADKYVRVMTSEREYLIRTPLKEMVQKLDMNRFWQVHRSAIVNIDEIASVNRDDTGHQVISLKSRPEKLIVSRIYAHLFKAM